jgi:hypothetical protein
MVRGVHFTDRGSRGLPRSEPDLLMKLRPFRLAAAGLTCLLGFGIAAGTPPPEVVSVRTLQPANYFVMHQGFVARTNELRSTRDARDSQMRIVQGLSDARCVSFQSVTPPDHYFKAAFFRIVLAKRLDEPGFREDATFCIETGLEKTRQWGTDAISFRSVRFPERYIRHVDGELRLDALEDTPAYRSSATFFIVPQAKFGLFQQEGTWYLR